MKLHIDPRHPVLRCAIIGVLLCAGLSACYSTNRSPAKEAAAETATAAFELVTNSSQPGIQLSSENPTGTDDQSDHTEFMVPVEIGGSLSELKQETKEQGNHICGGYNYELFRYGDYYVLAETGVESNATTDEIKGYAVFSEDHELLASKGTLHWMIDLNNPRVLIGHSFDYVQAAYGPFHFNSGSGEFYPGYITSEGYIVVLSLDRDNTVVAAYVYDHSFEDPLIVRAEDSSSIDD